MLVTTSYQPSEKAVERAKGLANELQCRWVMRKKDSLSVLKSKYNVSALLIVTNEEIKYIHHDHPPLFFHPSTALIRIKRLIQGERDTLMECSSMSEGDAVLDCTAGMASDSIVFSYTGGPASQIVALESEFMPFLLLREGLRYYESEITSLNQAMRRIQVECVDHLTYLKKLPDNSFDIVYFDPMFRNPIENSYTLTPLRAVANHKPLQREVIQEAIRTARKTVVLKEHRNSQEFERLGFTQVYKTYSKIAYGVIKL